MIDLQTRPYTTGEQQCLITDNFGIWTYTTLQNPTVAQINQLGKEGWHLNQNVFDQPRNIIWYVFEKGGEKKIICGVSNFSTVGQAVSATSTSEFIIEKKWTYGEISQTSLLFFIGLTIIFLGLYFIIKRKRKYEI